MVRILKGFQKKVGIFLSPVLKEESKPIIVSLLNYDTIKLREYIKIVNTGDLTLLGTGASSAEINEAWEKIVQESGKHTGDQHFDSYFELIQMYGSLLSDYTTIKATLSQLAIQPTKENVDYLKTRGYVVQTGSIAEFETSLVDCITKSSNLVNKINAAYNELVRDDEKGKDEPSANLGQLIAGMNFALGSNYIGTEVLLSEYNEYKKIVKAKQRNQNGRA